MYHHYVRLGRALALRDVHIVEHTAAETRELLSGQVLAVSPRVAHHRAVRIPRRAVIRRLFIYPDLY